MLLNCIKTSYEPSKVELQLRSKTVRYFWTLKCQLILKNDILFYRLEDPICSKLLFLAPRQIQEKCMNDYHDTRADGHLAQYKTLEKLRQSVIWYNMTRDSKLHVKTCAKNRRKTLGVPNKNWINITLVSQWKGSTWPSYVRSLFRKKAPSRH